MKTLKLAAVAVLMTGLAACVAGTGPSQQAAQGGSVKEITLGFWHGLIAPVTLVGEVVNEVAPGILPWKVQMYEKQSNGALYDVGFFVGLFAAPSFLTAGVSRRRRIAR